MATVGAMLFELRADLGQFRKGLSDARGDAASGSSAIAKALSGTGEAMGGATEAVRRAGPAISQTFDDVKESSFGLGEAIAALVGAFAFDKVVDGVAKIQNAKIALEGASGSAQKAREEYEFVGEAANKLGLDHNELSASYARLMIATRGTALEGERTRDMWLGLATAARGMGGDTQKVNDLVDVYTRTLSKNSVEISSLSRVLAQFPGGFHLLAESLGVSDEQLRRMEQTATIRTIPALYALSQVMRNQFSQAAQNASQSIDSWKARVSNAFDEVMERIGQSGFADHLTAALKQLTETLKTPDVARLGDAIGSGLAKAVTLGADALAFMGRHVDALKFVMEGLIALKVVGWAKEIGVAIFEMGAGILRAIEWVYGLVTAQAAEAESSTAAAGAKAAETVAVNANTTALAENTIAARVNAAATASAAEASAAKGISSELGAAGTAAQGLTQALKGTAAAGGEAATGIAGAGASAEEAGVATIGTAGLLARLGPALLNPWIAIPVVIGGAIAALYHYRDAAVEVNGEQYKLKDFWNAYVLAAKDALAGVETIIKSAWQITVAEMKISWNAFLTVMPDWVRKITDQFTTIWNDFKAKASGAWDWVKNNVANPGTAAAFALNLAKGDPLHDYLDKARSEREKQERANQPKTATPAPAKTEEKTGNTQQTPLGSAFGVKGDGLTLISERIQKLKAQAESEGVLANAIKDEVASTVLATAAAQAQKTIDELNAEGKKKNITVTEQQAASIRRLTALMASYKEAVDANKSLEAEIQKSAEAVKAQQRLADAYNTSYAAVKQAEEANKVSPFAKQVTDLEATIEALKKLGATDKQLAPLVSALDSLKQKLAEVKAATAAIDLSGQIAKSAQWGLELRTQTGELEAQAQAIRQGTAALHAFNIEQQLAKFQRENPNLPQSDIDKRRSELTNVDHGQQEVNLANVTHQLDLQADALKRYGQAAVLGAAALRQFNVEQQLTKFKEENPGLSDAEYAAMRTKLEGIAQQEAQNAAADKVHAQERFKDIEEEIRQLERLREQIISNGQSTLAVDRAIIEAEREKRDAEADAKAASSGVGGGIQAGLQKYANEWKGAGTEAMNATVQALHGIQSAMSNAFEQMIMGTKTVRQAFAEMGRAILSSIVQACAQMIAKWLVTHVIMAAISKAFGGDDGTASDTAKKVAASKIAVEADAGQASADVFVQAIEHVPFPANLGVAPALALATHAEVSSLAAFDNGGIMRKTGLALVHQDEGVLTKPAMNLFTTILKNQKASAITSPFQPWAGVRDTSGPDARAIAASGAYRNYGFAPAAVNGGDISHSYQFGDIHVHGASNPRRAADQILSRMKKMIRTGGVHSR